MSDPSDFAGSDERRKARSLETLVALARLLDGSRRIGDLEAVAVGDESGCLVAGAGPFRTCEELSAWGALERQPANDVVPTRLDVLLRKSECRRLSINGIEVVLAASGDDPATRRAALDHAEAGCYRILGRRAVRPKGGARN